MIDQSKPTVVVSRCLGFDKCRYNGDVIHDDFVERLKPYVNYITVCPEVEIGLGVPRNPIRLVMEDDVIDLYEPETEKVYTEDMKQYSADLFESLDEVHGFLLKGRSPSCGIKNVKIYLGKKNFKGSIKGAGIFAAAVKDKYPSLPMEEEGRLTNYSLRENFLIKLYTFFRFEKVMASGEMKDLIEFHANNKYLLMAYSQNELKNLGQIVANHEKKPFSQVIGAYHEHLGLAFAKPPKRGHYINVLMHILGYFSEELSSKEKEFILDRLDKYKQDHVHLSVVVSILQSYVIQYDQAYLLSQTIWETYPEELLDIKDSGKKDLDE